MSSVTVTSGGGSVISTSGPSQRQRVGASIVVKRATDVTLQSLNNVDATDLQDGYTLIYDSETNKFVTSPLTNVALTLLDGGTY